MNKSLFSTSFRLFVSIVALCVVMPFSAMAQTDAAVNGANNVVSGTVVDATGYPVIGAAVLVKGTTQGASTDVDGRFSFELPSGLGGVPF